MTTTNRAGRFAPSRFYFPLSKLIAFAMLRRKPLDVAPGRYSYTFHSEHSRIEAPAISAYIALFTYVFFFAFLDSAGWPWLLATIAAALIGTLFWTGWVCAFGVFAALLGGWGALRVKLQTIAMVGSSALMAFYLLKRGGFYAAFAVPWVLWLLLNLLAWPFAAVLRETMFESEKDLGQ